MKRISAFIITAAILLIPLTGMAQTQDYKASLFGIESNGTTLNTTSIQAAIDYVHSKGGGRLMFYVGRYLTGTIYLKSNVTLHLEEGAILVGSTNPFDYGRIGSWQALIFAQNQDNIAITGKGVIDGQGYKIANNVLTMVHKGIIKDPQNLIYDRPREGIRPQNIYFKGCSNVRIQGIMLKDPGSWNQQYDQCKNLIVEGITVDSKSYWNNDGVDIVDCDSVIVRNNFFDAADDGICLKSHSPDFVCKNVFIYNNVVRTSANGIKFGTASRGGFKNIKIINNVVYNTYRSAITFAAVDGGFVEDIVVDSLKSINTGNVIFLRIGERIAGKKGRMNNISISNIYATVPLTKPDAGYSYEGPVEDLPRNISPSSIIGAPDAKITNVTLKNIEIHYPGGGDPNYAQVGLDELNKVPEMLTNYPEFSMFKELPAWGFYLRHAENITFENVSLFADKEDYRRAFILDDVKSAEFKGIKVMEPGKKKDPVYSVNSSGIKLK